VKLAVETLKHYHQDDNNDDHNNDEKGDEGKDADAKPDNDAG